MAATSPLLVWATKLQKLRRVVEVTSERVERASLASRIPSRGKANEMQRSASASGYTDMQEKATARFCELAPAARGSQEAGITQPSLHLFLHICMCIFGATWVDPRERERCSDTTISRKAGLFAVKLPLLGFSDVQINPSSK